MATKTSKRTKHIPQRTCVGCRMVMTKRTLIRIVRAEDCVKIDPTGKASGRGAYIHNARTCWEKALKGPLAHALKTEISAQDRAALQAYLETLPPEDQESLQAEL